MISALVYLIDTLSEKFGVQITIEVLIYERQTEDNQVSIYVTHWLV